MSEELQYIGSTLFRIMSIQATEIMVTGEEGGATEPQKLLAKSIALLMERALIPPWETDNKEDANVSLTLKQSSWKNLFKVIEHVGFGSPNETLKKAYLEENGEHWSVGNVWAAIQHLRTQFESKKPEEK